MLPSWLEPCLGHFYSSLSLKETTRWNGFNIACNGYAIRCNKERTPAKNTFTLKPWHLSEMCSRTP
jgi:hypothetical protein